MADVVQKIITGNPQPRDGRAILQAPLAFSSGYQILNPPVDKGLTVSEMETRFTSRFDRPRYYTSTPSGLPY